MAQTASEGQVHDLLRLKVGSTDAALPAIHPPGAPES